MHSQREIFMFLLLPVLAIVVETSTKVTDGVIALTETIGGNSGGRNRFYWRSGTERTER